MYHNSIINKDCYIIITQVLIVMKIIYYKICKNFKRDKNILKYISNLLNISSLLYYIILAMIFN